MAGFTNYAFRQIVREFGGAGLLATEMVCAKGFVWLDEHEADLIEDTRAMLRIPSLESEAAPNAPFGAENRRALDLALSTA